MIQALETGESARNGKTTYSVYYSHPETASTSTPKEHSALLTIISLRGIEQSASTQEKIRRTSSYQRGDTYSISTRQPRQATNSCRSKYQGNDWNRSKVSTSDHGKICRLQGIPTVVTESLVQFSYVICPFSPALSGSKELLTRSEGVLEAIDETIDSQRGLLVE